MTFDKAGFKDGDSKRHHKQYLDWVRSEHEIEAFYTSWAVDVWRAGLPVPWNVAAVNRRIPNEK